MKSLYWFMARLSRMTAPEIIHRVQEVMAKRRLSRQPNSSRVLIIASDLSWVKFLPQVKVSDHAPRPNLQQSFRAAYGLIPVGPPPEIIKWTQLLSGEDTVSQPSFGLSSRKQNGITEDVRIPWELNRLTWLIPSAIPESSRVGRRHIDFRQVVQNFLDSDIPGKSLRWNSMIELAIQAVSLVILNDVLSSHNSPHDLSARIDEAISHRHRWITMLPSRYSSANNHRLAELVALVVIEERAWGDASVKVIDELAEEINKQFLPSGFNAELSFGYHLFALDLLTTAHLLAPRSSARLHLASVLETAAKCTLDILAVMGTWPSANDADDARILGELVPMDSYATFLCEVIRLSNSSHAEAATAGKPAATELTLSDAGYSFVSLHSREAQMSLMVDHGNIGYGRIAAHGHADALGIWLFMNGEPVLVEPGTFSYNVESAQRNLLRSSSMHNTVTVDEVSLSTPLGPFLWNPKDCARGVLESFIADGEVTEISLRAERRNTILARRRLKATAHQLLVCDQVITGASIQSHFIIHPDFALVNDDFAHRVHFQDSAGRSVIFTPEGNSSCTVSEVPYSPAYGELRSATRISFSSPTEQTVTIELDWH